MSDSGNRSADALSPSHLMSSVSKVGSEVDKLSHSSMDSDSDVSVTSGNQSLEQPCPEAATTVSLPPAYPADSDDRTRDLRRSTHFQT